MRIGRPIFFALISSLYLIIVGSLVELGVLWIHHRLTPIESILDFVKAFFGMIFLEGSMIIMFLIILNWNSNVL